MYFVLQVSKIISRNEKKKERAKKNEGKRNSNEGEKHVFN